MKDAVPMGQFWQFSPASPPMICRHFTRMKKYDDAAYYTGSGHSEDHAIAHIALDFRWCILRGLVGEEHTEDEEFESFKDGNQAVSDYLWETITGKLSEVDLNEQGNAFTRSYFSGLYPADLADVTGCPLLQFTEREVDFARLAQRIDQRYSDWQSTRS
jgi:hypothetical protein